MKNVIIGFLPDEVKQLLVSFKQPAYRAKQLLEWIYKKKVISFGEMTNLSKDFKQLLEANLEIIALKQQLKLKSKKDNTVKYAFNTNDGQIIESVFIPTQKRATICISTQAGCAYGCIFCASGKKGFKRNLTVDEIVGQVLLVKNDNSDRQITNIVIMGMGEPLANYANTIKALKIFNSPDCFGIGARKITLSTCGLCPQIIDLANEGIQIELSISLHAADDKLRSKLMPVNRKYPLNELIKTVKKYMQEANRIVTFEYIIINAINDSKEDALKLSKLLKGFQAKVNIIPFNPVQSVDYLPVTKDALEAFCEVLEKNKTNYTIRRSRGSDIQGACGQLRASLENRV
ncbi:MAG: 23S rRNA (adenine(2503)-C(2))-methyltransferase RlmN [Candidatus Omnitrophica bacterium]|nr:23S rRNA (adenine(2503)-C(2))-methyltransferase RlmN [Candidatus Omnitrophota bacterium]